MSDDAPPTPRRRRLRLAIVTVAAIFGLAIVIAAVTPTILSTGGGRAWLLARVNESLPGTVSSDALELRWAGDQRVVGLRLVDPAGREVMRCRELRTDLTLWKIARGKLGPGRVAIDGLDLALAVDGEGRLNLASAIAAPDDEPSRPLEEVWREFTLPLPGSLDATIELTNSRLSFRAAGRAEPVALEAVNGRLEATTGKPLRLDVRGRLGARAPVHLTATVAGFDDDGTLHSDGARIAVALEAELGDADDLHESVRLLRLALGDSLNVSLEIASSEDAFDAAVTLEAPRASVVSSARATIAGDRALELTQPLRARLVLAPALVAESADATLASEVPLEIHLSRARVPLDGTAASAATLEGRVTIGDGRGTVRGESVAWRDWRATFSREPGADVGRFDLRGVIEKDGQEGTLSLEGRAGATLQELAANVSRFPLAPVDRLLASLTGREPFLVDALGPRLDLNATLSPEGGSRVVADIEAKTDRLTLRAPLTLDRERGTLTGRDIELDYAVEPFVLRRWLGADAPVPDAAIPLAVRIPSMSVPTGRFQAERTAIEASIAIGDGRLDNGVAFRDVGARIDTPGLAGEIAFQARAGLGEGTLSARGTLSDLFDAQSALQLDRVRGRLEIGARALPLGTVDRLVPNDLGLDDLLGPTIDANVVVEGDGTNATARLGVETARLNGELALVLDRDRIRLETPAEWRATIPPAWVAGRTAWRIDANAPVTLLLDRLELPIRDLAPANVAAAGKLVTGEFAIRLDDRRLAVRTLEASFHGPSVDAARIELVAAVDANGVEGTALGGTLRLQADADLGSGRLDAKLASPRMALGLRARRDGDRIRLAEPAEGSYELPPELLREAGWPPELLAAPARVTLRVDELSIGDSFALDGLRAKAELRVPEWRTRLRDEPGLRDVVVSIDGADALAFRATATASAGSGTEAGSLDVHARLDRWIRGGVFDRAAPLTVRAKLTSMPTALAGSIARLEQDLAVILGPTADVAIDAELPAGLRSLEEGAGGAGHVEVSVQSARLAADARLRAGATVSLERPANARFTLTPAAARALGLVESLDLAQDVVVDLQVPRVALVAEGDRSRVEAKATGRIASIELRGKEAGAGRIGFTGLSFDLVANDLREAFRVELRGGITGGAKPGTIRGTIDVGSLGTRDELRDATITADLDLEGLPVAPLDQLLQFGGQLHAVLGDEAAAKATARLERGSGPIDLDLDARNLTAKIAARASPVSFTLREPVTAELAHTEKLARLVLPKLGPFFDGISRTEQPIRLRVEPRGVVVPRPFSLRRVVLPTATLDVGRVVLENQKLVDVIKKLAQSSMPERTDAWFTPLQIEMRNGRIRYERRLDVLFDHRIQLATWGDVDLPGNRLDMVFAVMPATLKKVLHLGDGRTDTLQIPIRGTLDQPRIELGRAVADLATIRAKEEALKKAPPLVREIADRALAELLRTTLGGLPPKQSSVDPLPWDVPREGR